MTRKEIAFRLLLGTAVGGYVGGNFIPRAAQAACWRCTLEDSKCKDVSGQQILGATKCSDDIKCKLKGRICGSALC
jgi:hypothetical protein